MPMKMNVFEMILTIMWCYVTARPSSKSFKSGEIQNVIMVNIYHWPAYELFDENTEKEW